ncbi:hypothetical protein ACVTMO_05545 [Pseudomonas segetis]
MKFHIPSLNWFDQPQEANHMDIRISPLSQSQDSRWQVIFDGHKVTFNNEADARNFASTLLKRLQAPHDLPDDGQSQQTDASGNRGS